MIKEENIGAEKRMPTESISKDRDAKKYVRHIATEEEVEEQAEEKMEDEGCPNPEEQSKQILILINIGTS